MEMFDTCRRCKALTLWTRVDVMVLSAGGAQKMSLWSCEKHPLPEMGDTDSVMELLPNITPPM